MKNFIGIFMGAFLSVAVLSGCCGRDERLNDLQNRIEDLTFGYQLYGNECYLDTIKSLLTDNAEIFKSDESFYDYYISKNLFVFSECDNPHECVKFLDKVIDENKIPKDSLYMVVLMKNRFASMDALKRNDAESAKKFISHNLDITRPIVSQYENLLPQFADQNSDALISNKSMGDEGSIEHKVLSALYNYLSDLGRFDESMQQSEINRIKGKYPQTKELIDYWMTVISDPQSIKLGL